MPVVAVGGHDALGKAIERMEHVVASVTGGMLRVVSQAIVDDAEAAAATRLDAASAALTEVARRYGLYDDEHAN